MAILGIDEVGRGPWAGPLVVGACVLPEPIEGLTDSKKLTAKRREALAKEIQEKAVYGLGWVSAEELDEIGLSAALRKACREAVKQIKTPYNKIVIDGTINFLSDTPLGKYVSVLPKADFLVPEVSAASIIAKVSRDNYMVELAKKYPGYSFEKHVGYGTAAHKKALEQLGVCPEHRKSFKPIAQLIGNSSEKQKDSPVIKASGALGEESAAAYLESNDHEILYRNWKNKFCEIDIISEKDSEIYFTEVKYRRNTKNSSGFDSITDKKLNQMNFAAELFISSHKDFANKKLHLAAIQVEGDNYKITGFEVLE